MGPHLLGVVTVRPSLQSVRKRTGATLRSPPSCGRPLQPPRRHQGQRLWARRPAVEMRSCPRRPRLLSRQGRARGRLPLVRLRFPGPALDSPAGRRGAARESGRSCNVKPALRRWRTPPPQEGLLAAQFASALSPTCGRLPPRSPTHPSRPRASPPPPGCVVRLPVAPPAGTGVRRPERRTCGRWSNGSQTRPRPGPRNLHLRHLTSREGPCGGTERSVWRREALLSHRGPAEPQGPGVRGR